MDADAPLTIGDLGAGHALGRYELLVPVAQGGMAVVWAARLKGKRRFQKIVALKSLLPALGEDPQFEKMFMSEAELASRIKHPNVCEIMDLGEEDGVLYIVMEWIDGEPVSSLRRAAKESFGGLPPAVAAHIAAKTAAGLHAAHELKDDDGDLYGLVHRDVSPQNIMVTGEGLVKVVDFGVAKATASNDAEQTRAGQIKGKVPFMAPEQALGRKVDRRTDVFSLGTVLFQLVTGKHPWKQKGDIATLKRICDKHPVTPPSAVVKDLAPGLEKAIVTALKKNPDERYADMSEFKRALEEAIHEMDMPEEDITDFVRKVMSPRLEKRRAAIKDAIGRADARTSMPDSGEVVSTGLPETSSSRSGTREAQPESQQQVETKDADIDPMDIAPTKVVTTDTSQYAPKSSRPASKDTSDAMEPEERSGANIAFIVLLIVAVVLIALIASGAL